MHILTLKMRICLPRLLKSLLRVEFLFKTDSEYARDAEVTLFTLANPGSSLRFNTHWSAPPVSALARSGGPRKMSQSPVSRNSNIERRMEIKTNHKTNETMASGLLDSRDCSASRQGLERDGTSGYTKEVKTCS